VLKDKLKEIEIESFESLSKGFEGFGNPSEKGKGKGKGKVYTDQVGVDEYFLNDLGWKNDIETYQAIKKLFSKLLQMKVPLSFEQHTALVGKWTSPKVRDIYSEMQNYSKLLFKNDEAAKTANNWLKRNAERVKK